IGGPVFLAGYLGMVWPLVGWRILQLARALRGSSEGGRLMQLGLVFYALLAVIQCVAIILAQSRGPLLGWLASLTIMSILMGTGRIKRWLLIAPLGVCALILGFLILLNIPSGPFQHLRSLPILDRFSHTFYPREGSGFFRSLTWQQAPKLLFGTHRFSFPDGHQDVIHKLRPLLGYGPETV